MQNYFAFGMPKTNTYSSNGVLIAADECRDKNLTPINMQGYPGHANCQPTKEFILKNTIDIEGTGIIRYLLPEMTPRKIK